MLLFNLNYTINHIYREGNACADWLAKMGCIVPTLQEFDENNIPLMLRGLTRLDKIGLPYIRAS
ncbi:hypothetical protein MA16_Dca009256 [Dendrobium catenatum]|uniref:RNase H type-1 domain-containing protein n=1 Tax=Dendrobium catenatum TaxID=906689 RepID=A0A2I0WYW4_9ASPA|nr:hypothetical protein MA16_Dca009256 [Dendrobium catenatum]